MMKNKLFLIKLPTVLNIVLSCEKGLKSNPNAEYLSAVGW